MACVEEGTGPGNVVRRCQDPASRRLGPLGAGLHRALVCAPDGDPAGVGRGLLAATAQRRVGRQAKEGERGRGTGLCNRDNTVGTGTKCRPLRRRRRRPATNPPGKPRSRCAWSQSSSKAGPVRMQRRVPSRGCDSPRAVCPTHPTRPPRSWGLVLIPRASLPVVQYVCGCRAGRVSNQRGAVQDPAKGHHVLAILAFRVEMGCRAGQGLQGFGRVSQRADAAKRGLK